MGQVIGVKEIKEILPFRYPFLFLDRAELGEDEVKAVKNLTMDEEFFQGHFPGAPIMPGVLQVETMFQAASLLLINKCGCDSCVPQITKLSKVKFRKPVLPGDRLLVEVAVTGFEDDVMSVKATTSVDGAVTSQGEITLKCLRDADMASLTPSDLMPALKSELICEDSMTNEDVVAIQKVIPHRYPFILVDKILCFDPEGKSIVGLKNISGNEPFFAAYPDEWSMVPNSLQMEIAAQVGCKYMLALPENEGKIGYFMSIDNAVYHKPVLPGDQIVVSISLAGSRGRFGKGDVKMYVGEDLVTECSLKFAIGD